MSRLVVLGNLAQCHPRSAEYVWARKKQHSGQPDLLACRATTGLNRLAHEQCALAGQ